MGFAEVCDTPIPRPMVFSQVRLRLPAILEATRSYRLKGQPVPHARQPAEHQPLQEKQADSGHAQHWEG